MATVKYDSEAMVSHVAAVPIDPAAHFITVTDHRQQPLVFSIGNDELFYMTKVGESGDHELINLAQKLGFPDTNTRVRAFGISQDQDGMLYLTVVTKSGGSTIVNLFQPFDPSKLDEDSIADLGMSHSVTDDETEGRIVAVKVGACSPEEIYPNVLATFKDVRSISTTQDLARVVVDESMQFFKLVKDVVLPENADRILDMCLMSIEVGPAIASLYHIQGQERILVTTVEDYYGSKIHAELDIPPGMNGQAMTTALDDDGFTHLLAGGNGLYLFQASDIQSGGNPNCVTNEGAFASVTGLQSFQTDDKWTVWANHTSGSVGYVTMNSDGSSDASPVTVLPAGKGGRFSPYISTVTGRQEFMVVTDGGQLSRLHQDTLHSGIWKTVPYFVPNLDKVIEYNSFMVHCTVHSADGTALVGTDVCLKSSGSVNTRIKGKSIDLSPDGVTITTDANGAVEFIVPRDELSSFSYSIGDVSGNSFFAGKAHHVYPDDHVYDRLSGIKTGDDLKNTKLPSGKHLVDPNTSKETLDNVAAAVQHLGSTREDMKKSNESQALEAVKRGHITPPKLVQRSQLACGENLDRIMSNANGILDVLWDAWNGLVNSVEKIVTWAIQKYEEGGLFYLIFEIDEQFYRWEISLIAHIGKALWSLWKKILQGIELLIEFIEFLFQWGDIQATHRSIVHLVNNALDFAIDSVPQAEEKTNEFFTGLEDKISSLKPYQDQTPLNYSSSGDESSKGEQLRKSAPFNYTYHQVQYGGASDASTINDTITGDPTIDTFINNILKPTVQSVENSVLNLTTDLKDLWVSKGTNMTVLDVTETIGVDFLVGFVDALKTIVMGAISYTGKALSALREVLNFEINIPVISWLYEKYVSGGSKLTILDAMAIIMAIPVTVGYKIIHNTAPPDLTSLDVGDLLSGNSKLTLEQNSFLGTMAIAGIVLMGILSTADVFLSNSTSTVQIEEVDQDGKLQLTVSKVAARRFRAPSPLLVQARMLVRFGKISQIFGLRKNPFIRGFAFLVIRGATMFGPALEKYSDLGTLKSYSWLTAFLVDLTDVIVHYLLAEQSPEKFIMKAVAVIGFIAEIVSSSLDMTVTGLHAKRDGPDLSTIFEVLGSIGYILSCGLDALGVIDEDYESETAITAAGGISLGVGVASSMADLVFDVVHEIWNVQLNVRL